MLEQLGLGETETEISRYKTCCWWDEFYTSLIIDYNDLQPAFKMNPGTRSFAKFVNTIDRGDLFTCLALWMEECPLATSVCDFESLELGTCGGRENISINDEDTCSDVPRENGPLRKRSKRNNCIIEDKAKVREFDVLVRGEPNSISHHLGNGTSTGSDRSIIQDNSGCCEETMSNCIEASCVDEANKPSKTFSSGLNKIGVVMVDISSENIVAINCSRDNVHGVTSVLVDCSDRASNCVIYASRKPCSLCTKLMVQAGVSRVCYLPFEPENPDKDDLEKVEKLYRMSEIGQSIHVPNIQRTILTESELKRSPYSPNKLCHTSFMLTLLSRYWSEEWKHRIAQELKWPEYNECKQQVDTSMKIMLEWLARVTLGDLPDSVNFYRCDENTPNTNKTGSECSRDIVANHEDTPIIPEPYNPRWQELARHMSRMAHILAQRSNDPKRGVGAVILQRNQVVSACWNGYPPKASYGDFPRASHSDGPLLAKKYAFSIHAEQAAILGRNTRDVSEASSTMFVSKTPCDECVPLILKAGIKNVVFPRDTRKRDPAFLRYSLIQRSIALGKLNGFESRFSLALQKEPQSESGLVTRPARMLCFNGKRITTKSLATDATH